MSEALRRNPLDIPYLKIADFATAINASTGSVRNAMREGRLHGFKDGRALKIRECPREYLEALPPFQPGTMKAGPGRPRRQPLPAVARAEGNRPSS
jgi:hypothetical protein